MASIMQHGSGQWTCMEAGMPVKAQSVIISFPLVYKAQSGIGIP
jgi:hypothetical protein